MLDIRFGGLPCIVMGWAKPPGAVNANLSVPHAAMPDFPVLGVPWMPAPSWVPIRPRSRRDHLTVVK